MEQENTSIEETNTTDTGTESQTNDPSVEGQAGLREQVKKQVQTEQPRQYTLKVNGKQVKVDEKTAIAYMQKGMAADEKFQKSAQESKRLNALLAKAKQDPDAFIKQVLGVDGVEYAKNRLSKQLQELSLDPKQKELRKYKKQVEEYEAEKAKRAELEKKSQQEKAIQHWTQHYDKVLPEAIKSVGLPLTEDVVRHATDIMIANLEDGIDLPMDAIMELTKERYLKSVKGFLGAADREKLVQLLGQDIVSKLGMTGKKSAPKGKQSVQSGIQQVKSPKKEKDALKELQERISNWSKE